MLQAFFIIISLSFIQQGYIVSLISNLKKPFLDFLKSISIEKKENQQESVNEMSEDAKLIVELFKRLENKSVNDKNYDSSLVVAEALQDYFNISKSTRFNKVKSHLLSNKIHSYLNDYNYLVDKLLSNNIINKFSKIEMYDQAEASNHFYSLIKHGNDIALYIQSHKKYIILKNKNGLHFRTAMHSDVSFIVDNGFKSSPLFSCLDFSDKGFIASCDLFNDLTLPKTICPNEQELDFVLFNIHSGFCSSETEL